MVKISGKLSAFERLFGPRLVLASVAVVAATAFGTAGIAEAQSLNSNNSGPANVQMCKDHYKELGFKNRGQCVSFFNKHHGGSGYGGNGNGHGHHKNHHHFHFPHFNFGHWWHKFF